MDMNYRGGMWEGGGVRDGGEGGDGTIIAESIKYIKKKKVALGL